MTSSFAPARASAPSEPSSDAAPNPPIQPHDLLSTPPLAIVFDEPAPSWVRESLSRWPVVVVRRATMRRKSVPVGIRGTSRAERAAAWVQLTAVTLRTRPEDLAARRGWRTAPRADALPHFETVDSIGSILQSYALAWGPVGSLGYELATARPCLGEESDIDILIRAPTPMRRTLARELVAAFAALPVRVDVQVDAGRGAFALNELARTRRVLLRTNSGARLVDDPWAAAAGVD